MPSHNDYEVQSAGASPQRKKEGDPGEDSAKEEPVKTQIVWKNVMIYEYFHEWFTFTFMLLRCMVFTCASQVPNGPQLCGVILQ